MVLFEVWVGLGVGLGMVLGMRWSLSGLKFDLFLGAVWVVLGGISL